LNSFKRTLFFAPTGRGAGGVSQHKPGFSPRTRDVLTDAMDISGRETRGKRSKAMLTPASEVLFQVGRMISDDHGSLSAYVAEFMKFFVSATRCTIYLATKRNIGGEEKKILEHRLTVEQRGPDNFRTRNVDENYSITDARSRALIAFRQAKPTVLEFESRLRMVFRNLDRNNKGYETFRLRPENKEGMKAFIPFSYRKGSPIGLLVIEGDLRLNGCPFTGEDKLAFCGVASTLAGSQIAFQLMHKFDGTTKLKRKSDFEIEFEDAVKRYLKGKLKSVFVLLIDLDNFKSINDTYGHLKGDEILSKVAKKILESVRSDDEHEDARAPDNVARWGGEEYVALLSGDISQEDALRIAKRINKSIASLSTDGLKITASIGAVNVGAVIDESNCRSPKRCCEIVFDRCDMLMYQAKKRGKNRLYFTEIQGKKIVEVEYKNGSS
jgi:diguanylate cyclase (GGDEF)-like protein